MTGSDDGDLSPTLEDIRWVASKIPFNLRNGVKLVITEDAPLGVMSHRRRIADGVVELLINERDWREIEAALNVQDKRQAIMSTICGIPIERRDTI